MEIRNDNSSNSSSSLIITDGKTTVLDTVELDFTSGVVLTDLGGGIVGIAISGGSTNNNVDGGNALSVYGGSPFINGGSS